jgi:hypothetical protein
MAHRLYKLPEENKAFKRFKINLPPLTGKLGISAFVGHYEVFFGISVGRVEMEQIVRKRLVKVPKRGVKVFRFEP